MLGAKQRRTFGRRLLLAVGLVLLLIAFGRAGYEVVSSSKFQSDDFVEYWAAGRLNLGGGNPYAPDELRPLQQAAGRRADMPVLMWNPPWTLALVMPFAFWSYRFDRLLWLLLNLSILVGAVTYVWWYYGGPRKWRWVALLVLATYMPALWALRMGQISLLILAGILGFLHFGDRDRWFKAGVFAGLVAIKPQLIYLFWVALIVWVIDRRVWKVLLGMLVALVVSTALAWAANRQVITQYVAAALGYPPLGWATPTIGGLLRLLFGFDRFWLQLMPPLAGVLWFFWHWRRHRVTWRWGEQMPLLLIISFATTPYGWEYDQVVSLVPILQIAIWLVAVPWSWSSTVLVTGYVALNGLALAQGLSHVNAFWLFWLAPAFLVWYLAARRWLGPRESTSSRPPNASGLLATRSQGPG